MRLRSTGRALLGLLSPAPSPKPPSSTSLLTNATTGLFFIGYLAQLPANMACVALGARRWLAAILVAWGCVAAAFAAVRGEAGFLVLRLLLGLAESGAYPGGQQGGGGGQRGLRECGKQSGGRQAPAARSARMRPGQLARAAVRDRVCLAAGIYYHLSLFYRESYLGVMYTWWAGGSLCAA